MIPQARGTLAYAERRGPDEGDGGGSLLLAGRLKEGVRALLEGTDCSRTDCQVTARTYGMRRASVLNTRRPQLSTSHACSKSSRLISNNKTPAERTAERTGWSFPDKDPLRVRAGMWDTRLYIGLIS